MWERSLKIKDWATKHFKVLSGAHKGYFSTDLTPYIDDFFKEVDERKELIVIKAASQGGKTISVSMTTLYLIDSDPADMLLVIPSADNIPTYLRHKFDSFLAGCEKVKEKIQISVEIDKKRPRNADKIYPGGILSVIGSYNVKSLTAKYVFLDEVADFAKGTVSMIKERMKTFAGRGGMMIAVSTMEDYKDEISQLFDMCEVKYAHLMFCEDCGEYFYPLPEHIKYPTEQEFAVMMGLEKLEDYMLSKDYAPYISQNGYIECPHCFKAIDEKKRMRGIKERKNKTFQVIKRAEKGNLEKRLDIYEIDPNPKSTYKSVGFDFNSFVSGLITLEKLIQELYSATNDVELLQKYYIGYANRPYALATNEIAKHKDILLLGNGLGRGILPINTELLTLTVDTQKDYMVYALVSFDSNGSIHLVDCGEIYSFDELWRMLKATYFDSDGRSYGIGAYGHDRLGMPERTHEVDTFLAELVDPARYDMAATEDGRLVFPLMGATDDRQGRRLWKTKISNNHTLETAFRFNSTAAKDQILLDYIPRSIANVKNSLGLTDRLFYINQDIAIEGLAREKLSTLSPEMQLTSEEKRYEVKNGRTANVATWQVLYKGRHNHILDCVCMAVSLAWHKNIHLFKIRRGDIA